MSILTLIAPLSYGQITPEDHQPERYSGVLRIDGSATNGVQPYVEMYGTPVGWHVEVGFTFQTNFPRLTWLKITNCVGSKLELWTTNSVKILTTNQDVLRPFSLPQLTTSAEILHSCPRRGRQYQWISVGHAIHAPRLENTADFELADFFNIPFTNNYVLKVAPLIYKVETNEVTAHLIEYTQVKMRLLSDGRIEEIK